MNQPISLSRSEYDVLETWCRNAEQAGRQFSTLGHLPREHSTVDEEAKCGRFLGKQRRLFEAHELSAWQVRLLEAIAPGWTFSKRELVWEGRMSDLLAFRDEHGRLPSEDARDQYEQRLGKWLSKQSDNHLIDADLKEYRTRRLREVVPGWSGRIHQTAWDRTVAAVAGRSTERGSLPNRRSMESVEQTDGEWLHNQRNRLDPENPKHAGRIAVLDSLMPDWR